MPTTISDTSTPTTMYDGLSPAVAAELARIARALADHGRSQQDYPSCWGFPLELERTLDQLRAIKLSVRP